nr:hypothetical protein 46 [bacterium]
MRQIRDGVSEPVINHLEDDCIEILLERNGVTVRKVVSSYHLLQPAINQLEYALNNKEDG